jgi:hypothetical protein
MDFGASMTPGLLPTEKCSWSNQIFTGEGTSTGSNSSSGETNDTGKERRNGNGSDSDSDEHWRTRRTVICLPDSESEESEGDNTSPWQPWWWRLSAGMPPCLHTNTPVSDEGDDREEEEDLKGNNPRRTGEESSGRRA